MSTKRNNQTTFTDIDSVPEPLNNQGIEYYVEYISNLKHSLGMFDRNLGKISWRVGKALLSAREICRGLGGSAWGDFLRSIKLNPKTAYNCRRIAERIREDRLDMGYSEMLAIIYPSFKKDRKQEVTESEFTNTELDGSDAQTSETRNPDFSDPPKVYTFSDLRRAVESIKKLIGRELADSPIGPAESVKHYKAMETSINQATDFLGELRKELQNRIDLLADSLKETPALQAA